MPWHHYGNKLDSSVNKLFQTIFLVANSRNRYSKTDVMDCSRELLILKYVKAVFSSCMIKLEIKPGCTCETDFGY